MNETTNLVALVTAKYRNNQRLTYRAFADALNEHLVNTSITHASILNWEKGAREPGTDFLLICLVLHDDWRAEWALETLCAKLPEVFDRSIDGRLIMLTNRIMAKAIVTRVV
jgi:transcriptional regulator with XRE-family HTH domain